IRGPSNGSITNENAIIYDPNNNPGTCYLIPSAFNVNINIGDSTIRPLIFKVPLVTIFGQQIIWIKRNSSFFKEWIVWNQVLLTQTSQQGLYSLYTVIVGNDIQLLEDFSGAFLFANKKL
ncbi:MAG: hypothetical protein CBC46_03655, partial [Verrucomicrobiaceae bacterium TMED86]